MQKRYTLADRERLVREVQESGESVRVVAARHGVAGSVAYLWMREAKGGNKSEAPRFARVVRSAEVMKGISIEVGRARIQVQPGFDSELLRRVVESLSGEK